MRAAIAQQNLVWEDVGGNLEAARELISQAAEGDADIVVFPELFSTGVTLSSAAFAQRPDGSICSYLADAAREHGLMVGGSYIEEAAGGLPYNAYAVYGSDGKLLCKYHKGHLFSHNGEDTAYSEGEGLSGFEACGLRVFPLICYDLRFPELFTAAGKMGADAFIVAANWPVSRMDHWRALLKARAIENQAYVIGINCAGESPEFRYGGGSTAFGPKGELVGEAGEGPELLMVELDAGELMGYRKGFSVLSDKRYDYYAGLLR